MYLLQLCKILFEKYGTSLCQRSLNTYYHHTLSLHRISYNLKCVYIHRSNCITIADLKYRSKLNSFKLIERVMKINILFLFLQIIN